ncbi:MAG: hypothetical protein KC609_06205 [Myxococcales bacterium]|nr:hypothetical protein [Myxococcales bacterium]
MNSALPWMYVCAALGLVLLAIVLLVARRDRRGSWIKARLRRLRPVIVDSTVKGRQGFFRLDGRYLGRRVSIQIQLTRDSSDVFQFIYLDVPRQFHLLVEPKGPDSSRVIEVFDASTVFRTGIAELDQRFTIASRRREDCLDALGRPGMSALLQELFRDRYQTLRLENGRLEAKLWFVALDTLTDPTAIERRVQRLYQLCELLVQVRVREVDHERLRDVTCPYCRDGILNEPTIVACSRCQTPHHAECWKEAGGCAVFGCPGGDELRLEPTQRPSVRRPGDIV